MSIILMYVMQDTVHMLLKSLSSLWVLHSVSAISSVAVNVVTHTDSMKACSIK